MRISDWSSDVCSSDLARLPKPGRWMATFRHILAVPMLLTALGLGWVLSRQSSGGDGLTAGAAGAALLALALGWGGWRPKHGRRRSEERRLGKAWCGTGRCGGSPYA